MNSFNERKRNALEFLQHQLSLFSTAIFLNEFNCVMKSDELESVYVLFSFAVHPYSDDTQTLLASSNPPDVLSD